MLKELFDKGKCVLSFHSGDWRYVNEHACEQVQVCSRCHTESRQVTHTWQSWQYVASGACEMARRCDRCNKQENKTEHVWGAPIYEARGSCVQIRPCSRCGESSGADTVHAWDAWSYDTQGQCSQMSACSRCAAIGAQRRIAHDWGDWYKSEFYTAPVRVCRRCGEMIFDLAESANESVSLQMAHSAVQDVMQASDVEGARERITSHKKVLFSPVAKKYFDFAVDQLTASADAKDLYHKLAGVIDRCRREGVENVFSPRASTTPESMTEASNAAPAQPPPGPNAALDERLIGHWRHTEILGSGGFTMTIETHCLLDGSGGMQWFSPSSSGTNAPEGGAWSAANGTLNLKFDDGNRLAFGYVLEGATMFCPREGRYRLWTRIN